MTKLRIGRLLRAVTAVAAAASVVAPAPANAVTVSREGNQLVKGNGDPIPLLGVNRSGTEYMCRFGQVFDGPSTSASIRAIKSWHTNAVRVPLNEDCWLGINGIPLDKATYREAIHAYVAKLHDEGMVAILDLHVAAPGSQQSTSIIPMADADHAPAFWRSVARSFKDDRGVLFDLYNEPHLEDLPAADRWACWRDGCTIPAGADENGSWPTYKAAGMQDLVDAVRSTGARQVVMAGGLDWSRKLNGWRANRPSDPRRQLAASEHNYGILAPCGASCKQGILDAHKTHPVVVGELGQTDCKHDYIDAFMPWADRRGLSYLGWAWDAVSSEPGGWTCAGGPSLIEDYDGTPTNFGVGLRDHLRDLSEG